MYCPSLSLSTRGLSSVVSDIAPPFPPRCVIALRYRVLPQQGQETSMVLAIFKFTPKLNSIYPQQQENMVTD
jgi:hypothetical protein